MLGSTAYLIGLGHHNDRRCTRVDAPLLLGGRHALHAVNTRLVAQPQEGTGAGEGGTGELAAAGVRFGLLDDLQRRMYTTGGGRIRSTAGREWDNGE